MPLALLVSIGLWGPVIQAQASQPVEDTGVPVTSSVVHDVCGTCHESDAEGRLSRISARRDTPEGWERTIRRMVSLNGLSVEPETARTIVKALSNELGLAPEEALPARVEVERRVVDFIYSANREAEQTCSACHSIGRVMNQRRTRAEWELLVAMHRGYYPLVDTQVFRRPVPVGTPESLRRTASAEEGDDRDTVDRVIDHLAEAFPLRTPEWAAWSATMRAPHLEGRWLLSGHEPGRGAVFGSVTLEAVAGADGEFESTVSYRRARDGSEVRRAGRVIVYTGFQWRGRTTNPADEDDSWREVMFVDRDGLGASGRWFQGAYDEIGLDVTLRRDTGAPAITGVSPVSVRTSTSGLSVRIHGANLGAVSPRDIDLGPGVSVAGVTNAGTDGATIVLDVPAGAPVGMRDLRVGEVVLPDALAVYDRVDAIRVTPATGLARVGGVVFPKQYQQFEAWAYQAGSDGEPGTDDDLPLGPVEATWRLEEYAATYVDDDVDFVGAVGADGLFTPAEDGVNPKRVNPDGSNARNNVGDVWVVASYTPEGASSPLRARAHLLVTVPLYMRWEPRPTAQ